MKKQAICLATGLGLLMVTGLAQASLTTIGTAAYEYDLDGDGFFDAHENYNLIWDDDNNGNSVVWLDYSNPVDTWQNQMDWAAGLEAAITINLDAGYSVIWDSAWRLPETVDGPWDYGYDGTTTAGYNITSSEMGHLYYEELGNLGSYDTSGAAQTGYGLVNTGDFDIYMSPGTGPARSMQTSRIMHGTSSWKATYTSVCRASTP